MTGQIGSILRSTRTRARTHTRARAHIAAVSKGRAHWKKDAGRGLPQARRVCGVRLPIQRAPYAHTAARRMLEGNSRTSKLDEWRVRLVGESGVNLLHDVALPFDRPLGVAVSFELAHREDLHRASLQSREMGIQRLSRCAPRLRHLHAQDSGEQKGWQGLARH